jgi:hypothetical protein
MKVTVVKTHPAPATGDEYNNTHVTSFATAFGPTQEAIFPQLWERQVDDQMHISGMWLDDKISVWSRTRFDFFIRRDRVFVYVDGEQRLCSNLTSSPLTMAEGALGLWHILYHTSAEFLEIRAGDPSADPYTGQHHVLHNSPFASQRSWDNVGFQENVAAPAGFDPNRCL